MPFHTLLKYPVPAANTNILLLNFINKAAILKSAGNPPALSVPVFFKLILILPEKSFD